MRNIGGGDLMRVLVKGNSPPAAQADVGVVEENQTLTVTNDSGPNKTGDNFDAHLEHSGDLMDTSSSTHKDSDPNTTEYGDTFTVTAIKVGDSGLGGSTTVTAGSSYNSSGTSYRHLWNFNYWCGWKLSIYCRSSSCECFRCWRYCK